VPSNSGPDIPCLWGHLKTSGFTHFQMLGSPCSMPPSDGHQARGACWIGIQLSHSFSEHSHSHQRHRSDPAAPLMMLFVELAHALKAARVPRLTIPAQARAQLTVPAVSPAESAGDEAGKPGSWEG
jgi:hypothetical protein